MSLVRIRHALLGLLLVAAALLGASGPVLAYTDAATTFDNITSGNSNDVSTGDVVQMVASAGPLAPVSGVITDAVMGTGSAMQWLFAGSGNGDGQNFSSVYALVGGSGCTFCAFVGRFTQIVDIFAKNTFHTLQGPAANILTYLFAIWVTFLGGSVALGVGAGQSPTGFMWSLAKKSSLFFVLYFLLSAENTTTYWEWFYDAPMQVSSDLTDLVISTTPRLTTEQSTTSSSCFTPLSSGQLQAASGSGSVAPIGNDTLMKFICQVQVAESINKIGVAAAISNIRSGARTGSWLSLEPIANFVQAFVAALLLLFVFGVAMFYYAFLIIDVFFRIAFISALAPIFIIFYFFQGTRGWAKHVLNGLIASFATLFGANMVYSVVGTLISFLPEITLGSAEVQNVAKQAGVSIGDTSGIKIDKMFDILDSSGQYLNWGSAGLWYLLMSGLLAYAMSRRIGEMFSSIFGGFNPNFNMAESVTKIVQTGASMTASAVSLGVGAVAGQAMMNRAFTTSLSNSMGQMMGGASKLNPGSIDPRNSADGSP